MPTDDHPTYEIVVQGRLDPSWSDWFERFTISYPDDGTTLLTGVPQDQAQLYGVILKIRDLNLKLISVAQIGEDE